uniref:Mediator of RNA polymerase II transcription subunit 13 n=1 Tax=Candidozyma auris TaxID=498019 RepID=A0A0L0P7T9_CANAR
MSDRSPTSRISTHYYKIGHLLLVSYEVFSSKDASLDQYLLELELQIRNDYPRILLTYYNKSLYQFKFEHILSEHSTDGQYLFPHARLDELYPQLEFRSQSSIPACFLSKPTKSAATQTNTKRENQPHLDNAAFIPLTFFKAVKKMILYNICLASDLRMFGNYLVCKSSDEIRQYSIVQIDPVVLENGDMLVSLSQMNRIALWGTDIVNTNMISSDITNTFVIYVIPSGLRCHFFSVHDFSQTFTVTPPKSSGNLLRLLKLSTGIDLSERTEILWVKLIPNLQHLNNQTSDISLFIHEVDNKKFILWPWELCLLQFGYEDSRLEEKQQGPSSTDPLQLIHRFIDSLAFEKEEFTSRNGPPFTNSNANAHLTSNMFNYNVPSSISTGRSSGQGTMPEFLQIKSDTPAALVSESNGRQNVSQLEELQQGDTEERSRMQPDTAKSGVKADDDKFHDSKTTETKGEAHMDDINDDEDLFGESSGSEDVDSSTISKTDKDRADRASSNVNATYSKEHSSVKQMAPSTAENTSSCADEEHINETSMSPTTFVNIPKDQMISDIESIPSSYKDPGAPLPIVPTPIIPQHSNLGVGPNDYSNLSKLSSLPHRARLRLERAREPLNNPERQGYVFSPLRFNPVIKSSIDTKYGKGGKFYVSQNANQDYEQKVRRPRETSVSHGSPIQLANDENILGDMPFFNSGRDPGHEASFVKPQPSELHESTETQHQDDARETDNDDEEESDFDEDYDDHELKTSPLQLNISNQDPQIGLSSTYDALDTQNLNHPTLFPHTSMLSPSNEESKNKLSTFESPPPPNSLGNIQGLVMLPVFASQFGNKDDSTVPGSDMKDGEASLAPTSSMSPLNSSSNAMGESSNCLPLILRSINVLTIPPEFIVERKRERWDDVTMLSGFDITVMEDMEDINDGRFGHLSVKSKNIEEYLKWVTNNVVFDFGGFEARNLSKIKLPSESIVHDDTPESEPSELVIDTFKNIFPLSFRMGLDEFRFGHNFSTSAENHEDPTKKNEMDLLERMNDNVELAGSVSQDMRQLSWDSIYHDVGENKKNALQSMVLLDEARQKWETHKGEDDAFTSLHDVKVKVIKNASDEINLDFLGLRFWHYLKFKPIHKPRNFQVLLISESLSAGNDRTTLDGGNLSFLSLLRNNYKDNHFGDIKRLSLQVPDDRQDLEGLTNGIILAENVLNDATYGKYYGMINRTLKSLAELIKLDLINKINRFDFDRPLLLLFISFDRSLSSLSLISKLCRNFKTALSNQHLSLVDLFCHIIPGDLIMKQCGQERRLRYLSNTQMTNISMLLYNKCPSQKISTSLRKKLEVTELYTRLVKESPVALNSKIYNRSMNADGGVALLDDLFLHVAYERSIDRRWVSAAWSDPHGAVIRTKSWLCSTKKPSSSASHDIGAIIGEIWDVSSSLFKILNDDDSRRACTTGGKRYLVLTRINSILPDDELVFWKRLTTKYKEMSLIVLSANRMPKASFNLEDSCSQPTASCGQSPKSMPANQKGKLYGLPSLHGSELLGTFGESGVPYTSSPANADMNSTSPINSGGITVQSPNQFMNLSANFLSPQDCGPSGQLPESTTNDEANLVLQDESLEIMGFIPQTSLPSTNSPTRLAMRNGYLIKTQERSDAPKVPKILVFEVSLLSCSNHWNVNNLMKILLNQLKKLIYLNQVVGVCDIGDNFVSGNFSRGTHKKTIRSIIPWHINAVGKCLDYLVHIRVDEDPLA